MNRLSGVLYEYAALFFFVPQLRFIEEAARFQQALRLRQRSGDGLEVRAELDFEHVPREPDFIVFT